MKRLPGRWYKLITVWATLSACGLVMAEVSPDDTARVLAGLEPSSGSPLTSVTTQNGWQVRSKKFDEGWKRLNKSQLIPITTWSDANIGDLRKSPKVLYYPFSGPDFLYAGTIFPDCGTYVLCGLEPVGPIPDLTTLTPEKMEAAIEHLQSSLSSIVSFSFFRTKDMKTDFQSEQLQGTTPVLLTFMAKMGKSIRKITLITLDKEGNVGVVAPGPASSPAERGSLINGVKVDFASGASAPEQSLYYFSTDISNDGIRKNPGFVNFCRKLDTGAGFVKAASFLMHEDYFSRITNMLLERCNFILQDDSGIPMAKFPAQEWELKPFGRYLGPIDLFKERFQPDLAQLYTASPNLALPFGIGYRHRQNESNLLLATKKATPAPAKSPTEGAGTSHP